MDELEAGSRTFWKRRCSSAGDSPLLCRSLRAHVRSAARWGVVINLLTEIQREWIGKPVELALVASGWRFQGTPSTFNITSIGSCRRAAAPFARGDGKPGRSIACQQPVTRGDIEAIRGVAVSTNAVKTLVTATPGRSGRRSWKRLHVRRYDTTKAFLDDLLGLCALSELLAEARRFPLAGDA